MVGIFRSELLKTRHTGRERLAFLVPTVLALLGSFFSGGSVQYAAYNWWYVMLLPVVVTVWAASSVTQEKGTGFQNLLTLPVPSSKIWLGKMGTAAVALISAHMVLWLEMAAAGALTVMHISPLNGLIGCALLAITTLWQIPFVMLLVKKLGQLPGVILSLFGNMILGTMGSDKPWFLFDLYAIPARVVCPFFKVHPNGLPLKAGSPLLESGQVGPAVCLSLLAAVVMTVVCAILLEKGDKTHG